MTRLRPMPSDNQLDRAKGLLIAAPSSGAGKTTATLSILRALKNSGRSVVSAKSGPDYIDPQFHHAATGYQCINLDAWAMDAGTLQALATEHSAGHDLLIVEGAMGLFDGAANGKGSAADLASALSLPIILVVDCAKQAQSVAALVSGFQNFRPEVQIASVILNRVGSTRHETMLRNALKDLDVEVLGALPRSEDLVLPERHLGLVQAHEHQDMPAFLEGAALLCSKHLDLGKLEAVASDLSGLSGGNTSLPKPMGHRIAIAKDIAFAFVYPHLLGYWRRQGAELSFFSPLADEAPDPNSDAIFLPGGYPELHAEKLAKARTFKSGMSAAAAANKLIYGECGGYMTLGEGLIDSKGHRHEMLGLLPLETSFQARKRHLGYRVLEPLSDLPWSESLAAHEFHYASIVSEGDADRLFAACDAEENQLSNMGLRKGTVMGSFAHVISVA
ncbi:MAG: cobyrinate a,c-diamide synthase [Roseibium sp.]